MKYPQAYIFFKDKFVLNPDALHTIIGEDVDVHFPNFNGSQLHAIDKRAKVVRSVLKHKGIFTHSKTPYIVLNVSELNDFFVLKYSSDIEGIVWLKSASEFEKIRSSLAVCTHFWLFLRGLYLSTRHYYRTRKVLGEDCPEFRRDDPLFSSLSSHIKSLEPSAILTAMRLRLNALARTGQYKL